MLQVVLLFSENSSRITAAAADFRPQALAQVTLSVIDVEKIFTFMTFQDELVVLGLVGRVHLFCRRVISVWALLLALRIRAPVVRLKTHINAVIAAVRKTENALLVALVGYVLAYLADELVWHFHCR